MPFFLRAVFVCVKSVCACVVCVWRSMLIFFRRGFRAGALSVEFRNAAVCL